jgi:hypothetical protein
MRRMLALVLVCLLLGPAGPGVEAAAKLRVVATIADLKALTEAVGGDPWTRTPWPAARRTRTISRFARASW